MYQIPSTKHGKLAKGANVNTTLKDCTFRAEKYSSHFFHGEKYPVEMLLIFYILKNKSYWNYLACLQAHFPRSDPFWSFCIPSSGQLSSFSRMKVGDLRSGEMKIQKYISSNTQVPKYISLSRAMKNSRESTMCKVIIGVGSKLRPYHTIQYIRYHTIP